MKNNLFSQRLKLAPDRRSLKLRLAAGAFLLLLPRLVLSAEETIKVNLTLNPTAPTAFTLNAGKNKGIGPSSYYLVEQNAGIKASVRISSVTTVSARGLVLAFDPENPLVSGPATLRPASREKAESLKNEFGSAGPAGDYSLDAGPAPKKPEKMKAEVKEPEVKKEKAVEEEKRAEEEPAPPKEEEDVLVSKVKKPKAPEAPKKKDRAEGPTRWELGLGYYFMSESAFEAAPIWSVQAKNVPAPIGKIGLVDVSLAYTSPDFKNDRASLLPGEWVDFSMWQLRTERCFRDCAKKEGKSSSSLYGGLALARANQSVHLLTGSVDDSATRLGISLRLNLNLGPKTDANLGYQLYPGSGSSEVNLGGASLQVNRAF